MPTKPLSTSQMPAQQFSTSNALEIALFTLMVAVIGTVAFLVMGELSLVTSLFLGGGIGVLAGIVLAILFRRPKPRPADKPVGHAPREAPGRDGPVVPARGDSGEPNTSLGSRTLAGAVDAGGVGRPATAAARSPLDPAEIPVAGAGGPLNAPRAADAAAQPMSGDDHARTPEARGPEAIEAEIARGEPEPVAEPRRATPASPRISGGRASGPQVSSPRVSIPRTMSPEASTIAQPARVTTLSPAKPKSLSAPRGGQADDLKAIRGIGPALERMLHGLGIYHIDQVAAWGPEEVLWANQNLEGYRGRASRDDWVGQARALTDAR